MRDPQQSPSVSISLLGGFGAAVEGEPVAELAWRLKKARELVKLLALAPERRLHREQAMEALWPERSPASGANNLNQAVHAARRALGQDAIRVRDELLSLSAEVDVVQFEQAAVAARRLGTPDAYRGALSLYRGELLPENRYDDWALARREELAQLHASLRAELAASPASDVLPGLPADTSSFVGREHELSELVALLRRTRLLTLSGTGGSGKTRLALELARRVEGTYEAGAALVDLGFVGVPSAVPDTVAGVLDVHELPGRPLLDALSDFLAPRNALLVLDNCEHLLGASATLTDRLLRAAPRLTIVATSREPLRVAGEVVFRVPSLALPDPEQQLEPDELLRYEAVRLFVDRAAAADPGFALDAENAIDVARICFRLDGLPLALELAAGRLGALGPAAVAERLDDRFRLLRAGRPSAPTRQQTLAAALQWSHDLLEDDERVLLRRLAVFVGGFELSAVEEVCTGEGLDALEAADVLARLVEKSLAVAERNGRERRYRLLETVRAYARERLDEAGEWAAAAERHAAWALALAERERGSPSLDPEAANFGVALDVLLERDPCEALRLCGALCPFWLRRIDFAEAERRLGPALAAAPEPNALRAEVLLAAARIDLRGGLVARGIARAEESLAVAVELDDAEAELRALHFLGEIAVNYEIDTVGGWLERALSLARETGLAAAEARCTGALAIGCWYRGDLTGAEEQFARALAILRTLETSPGQIEAPMSTAEVRARDRRGRPGPQVVLEDTLQPFAEISFGAAVGYTLANQAGIARARGDFPRAHALLDEAERRFVAIGDERGRADLLVRRAHLHRVEGSLEAARYCLDEALVFRRYVDDRRGTGLVLSGLSLIDSASGDQSAAERHLADARRLFRRAGDRWGLVSALWRTADLALLRDSPDDAEAALREAEAILAETCLYRWNGHTNVQLAEVAVVRRDLQAAADLLGRAREIYAARRDEPGLAVVDAELRKLAKRPQSGR